MNGSVQFGPKLSVALDVWGVGTTQPRGVINLKRQFARVCSDLAHSGELRVCFAGEVADRDWLIKEGLLEHSVFHRFRIPGRLQRIAAEVQPSLVGALLGGPDLYHSFTLYPFTSGHTRVIGTLVDFVPMRVPQFVPLAFTLEQVRWCQWAGLHSGAKWIAISDLTKRDALALGRLRDDQVYTVNLGAESDMFIRPTDQVIFSTLDSLSVCRPYLLCVNTLNLRKNHIRLLDVWKQGNLAEQGWTLVLVGDAAGHPLINKLQSGEFRGVKWLGYLPRLQLVHLYYGCEAVVYPSLYEGFGIPVAEAIAAGKPILASHKSSMADIAGEGAVYIDPWDVSSLARGLSEIVGNMALKSRLAEYNTSQRQKISMERMAIDLLKVYHHIVHGRP